MSYSEHLPIHELRGSGMIATAEVDVSVVDFRAPEDNDFASLRRSAGTAEERFVGVAGAGGRDVKDVEAQMRRDKTGAGDFRNHREHVLK